MLPRPFPKSSWTGGPGTALLVATLVGAGCTSDVRGQPGVAGAVVTYRAPGVDLGSLDTYALASRVGLVTDAQPGKGFADAPGLLAALEARLSVRGFTKVADVDPGSPPATPPAAGLAVNVTALSVAGASGGYWAGFGGYTQPADLGFPGYAWAYPWPWVPVAFQPGTLLVEISSLEGRSAGTPGEIPVVWAALAYGVAPGGDWAAAPVLAALDQAFAQSPYLVTPLAR